MVKKLITSSEGVTRADMMAIAECYATFEWIGRPFNVRNQGYQRGNAHPDECYQGMTPTDYYVDTPDAETPDQKANPDWPQWWRYGEDEEGHPIYDENTGKQITNVGIPYFWGGYSSIADDPNNSCPDLGLEPGNYGTFEGVYRKLYFQEELSAGHAAGDISINIDWDEQETNPEKKCKQKVVYNMTAGVDCAGFVSHVWRTGARWGTSNVNWYSRPIRFDELRAGDILIKYRYGRSDNHVILFKEFVNYEPGNGPPIPGVTRIRIFEAALFDGKVSEREMVLKGPDPLQTTTLWWDLGARHYETNIVTLRRWQGGNDGEEVGPLLEECVPRTYINPIDVILVIDHSASMASENKMQDAKEAARMFVDLMEPGGRIGIVPFYGQVDQSLVFQLTEIDAGGGSKGPCEAGYRHARYRTTWNIHLYW